MALDRVRIVLVATTHPGNVGATARAMKTMGLRDLALVAPCDHLGEEATARASGADDLLRAARVVDRLEDALEGCSLVFGTSARRRRDGEAAVPLREAAEQAAEEPGEAAVAVVFGTERTGLSNDELARCHRHVYIPTSPEFRSLNLASAVQLVCYELRLAFDAASPAFGDRRPPPAPADELERFYADLYEALEAVRFLRPEHPNYERIKLHFRRLFNRTRPDTFEMQLLRGWLGKTLRALGRR